MWQWKVIKWVKSVVQHRAFLDLVCPKIQSKDGEWYTEIRIHELGTIYLILLYGFNINIFETCETVIFLQVQFSSMLDL